MFRTFVRLIAIAGLLAAFALVAPASAQVAEQAARPCEFTVTDLPDDAQYVAINDRGQVPRLGELERHPTSRFHPQVTDINNAGVVVGHVSITWPDGRNRFRAVYWDKDGEISELPFLPGGQWSTANAINNSGLIVGQATGPPVEVRPGVFRPQTYAVIWTPGPGESYTIAKLSTPEGAAGDATDINDKGEVVGSLFPASGGWVPVVWDKQGNMTQLPLPSGYTIGEAYAINNQGQIVGYVQKSPLWSDLPVAVVWTPNPDGTYTLTELGTLPDGTFSYAYDINNRGQIVGRGGVPFRGLLWTPAPGGGYTLTVLDPLAGYPDSEGWAINNRGQVTGRSTGGGNQTPVLWDTRC